MLKDQLRLARSEIEELNLALQNSESRASASQISLAHIAGECQVHQKAIMVLECAIKDVEGQRDEIRDAYRKAESVIGKLHSEKDTLTKLQSLLERDLSLLSSEKEALHTKLASAEARVVETSEIASIGQKALAAKDEALAEAKEESSQLREQLDDGKKELESVLSNMQQVRDEMRGLQRVHELQMDQLVREQKGRYKTEMEDMQERHCAFLVELRGKHLAEIRDMESKNVLALRQVECEREKVAADGAAKLCTAEAKHAAILRENEQKHADRLKEVEDECRAKLDAMLCENQVINAEESFDSWALHMTVAKACLRNIASNFIVN